MLTVARNVADGKGWVYNYNVPTTGVQPLATVIYATIFKLGKLLKLDDSMALRMVIVFSGSFLFLLGILIYAGYRQSFAPQERKIFLWACMVFIIFNFDFFIEFTNGLETGIYLIFLFLSMMESRALLLTADRKERKKKIIIMGILWGLTALARLDFLVIAVGYLVVVIYKKKLSFTEAVLLLVIQAVVLLPWLYKVFEVTGGALQSSIVAQSGWVSGTNLGERAFSLLTALMEQSTPLLLTMHHYGVLFLLFSVTAGTFVFHVVKRRDMFFHMKEEFNFLLYWGFGFVLLGLSYLLYSNATYFYLRYMTPVGLFVVLVCVLLVGNMSKLGERRGFFSLVNIGIVALFFINAFLYFHSGKLGVPQDIRIDFIKNNFTDGIRIGSFQSGVTGFYCANVFNLDGKIDQRVLQGDGKNRIEKFLDENKIEAVIEWKEAFIAPFWREKWIMMNGDIGDHRTVCYIRKTAIAIKLQ